MGGLERQVARAGDQLEQWRQATRGISYRQRASGYSTSGACYWESRFRGVAAPERRSENAGLRSDCPGVKLFAVCSVLLT